MSEGDQEVSQVLQQLLSGDSLTIEDTIKVLKKSYLATLWQSQLTPEQENVDNGKEGAGTIATLGDDATPGLVILHPLDRINTRLIRYCLQILADRQLQFSTSPLKEWEIEIVHFCPFHLLYQLQ